MLGIVLHHEKPSVESGGLPRRECQERLAVHNRLSFLGCAQDRSQIPVFGRGDECSRLLFGVIVYRRIDTPELSHEGSVWCFGHLYKTEDFQTKKQKGVQ